MNSLLDLNDAVKVRNCTTQYFDEVQLSHRIIYSDVFDWILELIYRRFMERGLVMGISGVCCVIVIF